MCYLFYPMSLGEGLMLKLNTFYSCIMQQNEASCVPFLSVSTYLLFINNKLYNGDVFVKVFDPLHVMAECYKTKHVVREFIMFAECIHVLTFFVIVTILAYFSVREASCLSLLTPLLEI